ncbi:hypothetical protein [Brevibacillus borstelensis]|uniref:hypothetical protein n=1 Tax=Brevibacillus borstelensis TaxID=45462 RepID=UPI001561F776|nr:hypothetical protein [Brevibacillus borstelensis]MBE5394934.1 hypothetical protein [Brevibacillus borstelensis]MCM3472219.1 hypothetical protein [Brevibacillus borstelensis]WNF05478.1 hypothetical protein RFB14_24630 [Brevibacillus borstelensis]
MNQPKAYGSFIKRGDHTYRTSAYIQWGQSEKSIGACLLLNPGSADFNKINPDLIKTLNTSFKAEGELTPDPTMDQLILMVEDIYRKEKPIVGRFHIYNLFNLQNAKSMNAIDQFEALVQAGEYDISESLISQNELEMHPWLLLGWGVDHKTSWKNLERIKEKWLNLIAQSKVPTFGKKHKESNNYYHPCPLIPTRRPAMLNELITIYKQKFGKQRFPVHATKPNLLVEYDPDNKWSEFDYGWIKSPFNPECIVKGFSHLRIKDGYKLRAYQYTDGANGNGIVWAIPVDAELPDPNESQRLEEHFLSAPKPSIAFDDFMQVIEGDKTPISYLQASIVYHELNEFGAAWHGTEWGRDIILPIQESESQSTSNYEWEMIEDEPEIIDPHFYYDNEGNPTVVFYTINDIGTVTLNRYVHTFSQSDYTMRVERSCIATAGPGIIF